MTVTSGTTDAPPVFEVGMLSPPGPPVHAGPVQARPVPTVPGRVRARVVVRRLPPQQPISEPPEPEPVVDPPAAQPWTAGTEVAGVEVRTMLQLIMETLDGRRPRSQLGGRLSQEVVRYLAAANGRLNPVPDRRAGARTHRHNPPGLHSVHLCHPADGVTEASAVWRHRGRFRALAARFEWTGTRWRCTTLRLG